MRLLVTGAAGFIGAHVAKRLIADGHEVVGLDCFTDYYDPRLKERNVADLQAEVLRLDLVTDPLDEALEGVEGVFHLAAQPGVRASWGESFAVYTRQNLLATQRLFEAVVPRGLRVVYSSSSSIYGDAESYPTTEDTVPRPRSPYGVTKLAAEHLARSYALNFGLDVVSLRYFTVYGPGQRPDMAFTRVVNALRDGAEFQLFGDGTQSRDVTYVEDAAAATALAMERAPSGAVYNVGGGTEASMNEALEILERVSGRTLDLRKVETAAGDVKRTAADTSRIRAELGWRPVVGIEEGLANQWESALAGAPVSS